MRSQKQPLLMHPPNYTRVSFPLHTWLHQNTLPPCSTRDTSAHQPLYLDTPSPHTAQPQTQPTPPQKLYQDTSYSARCSLWVTTQPCPLGTPPPPHTAHGRCALEPGLLYQGHFLLLSLFYSMLPTPHATAPGVLPAPDIPTHPHPQEHSHPTHCTDGTLPAAHCLPRTAPPRMPYTGILPAPHTVLPQEFLIHTLLCPTPHPAPPEILDILPTPHTAQSDYSVLHNCSTRGIPAPHTALWAVLPSPHTGLSGYCPHHTLLYWGAFLPGPLLPEDTPSPHIARGATPWSIPLYCECFKSTH